MRFNAKLRDLPMLNYKRTDSRIRAVLVAGMTAIALAGCGDNSASSSNSTASEYEVEGDHVIGNPAAKVTIVEYASVVCGACANFHNTVYDDFKKKYVESGKVRFVFREFPTSPENLAQAGFLIANCAAEDKFFDNIALQFKRQRAILTSSDIRQEYVNIAKAAGLSEAEFEACMSNEEEIAKYNAVIQSGIDAGVTSTPTFFINGVKTQRSPSGKQLFTIESFDEVLAPLLGEDAPAPESASEGESEEGSDEQ